MKKMTSPYEHDQAERLREKMIDEIKERTGTYPSRSEVHKKRRKKKKKMNYPLLRILVFLFILVPVVVLFLTSYLERNQSNRSGENLSDFDSVIIKNNSGKSVQEERVEENNSSNSDKEEGNQNEQEASPTTEEQSSSNSTRDETRKEISGNESDGNMEENRRIITHVVQPNETLYKISMKYYKSRNGEKLIREWNHLQDSNIYVGQVLKIPLDNPQ